MMRIVNEKNHDLALIAESGLNTGSVFPLSESRLIIGRRVDASIPLDDSKASRDHAVVDRRNGHCLLADLGSTNGTYLNGERISDARRIKVGDRIRIGSCAFRVELFDRVRDESVSNHWNDVTKVDIQLENPPKIARSRTHAEAVPELPALEGGLETLEIHKELILQARREIFKKRVAFAAICLALILSAIFLI